MRIHKLIFYFTFFILLFCRCSDNSISGIVNIIDQAGKEKYGNSYLGSLEVVGGQLSPNFSSTVFIYDLGVASIYNKINLIPHSLYNPTIRINNQIVNSGTYSQDILLPSGDSIITIIVTSEDKKNQTAYFFNVSHKGGEIDHTFNSNPGTPYDTVFTIQEQNDKIIIGGMFTQYNGTSISKIARLNQDGSLDSSFDIGLGFNNTVINLFIQSDNKILVSGFFTQYNGTSISKIARLNQDGSLDTTFNPGTGPNDYIHFITQQTDGKILVCGRFSDFNGTPINNIARLNQDGSLDSSFTPGTGPNQFVEKMIITSNNKIIIIGSFSMYNGTDRNRIARLNSNGTLDTSFDSGIGTNGTIVNMTLQSDGKIIISGLFTSVNGITRNRIARLNSNGSHDISFNPGTGANDIIRTIRIQDDEKIMIAGNFNSINGILRPKVARLNANGSLDINFAPNSGINGEVWSMLLQPNGMLFLGGLFSEYSNQTYGGIVRIYR